jgi:4-amino-4-deoxy-L-arabinose transferase-like glycosyltransferase
VRLRPALLAAAALSLAGLAWQPGGYALLEPDEGRNAEVMRELGDGAPWWLPRLNHVPYVDKPIVHFAAGAVTLGLFGRTETAARLPSLLFTLGTLAVVWGFARRIAGPQVAWHAAIMTAAAPLTLAYARTVIFDATLTFFVTSAIAAFALGVSAAEAGRPHGRWSLLGWAALAMGVLTKGPVALALPLLVALPHAGWRRRPGVVLDPRGMLLLLALVLPWVFAMSTVVPDFVRYVLFVETVQRMGTDVLGRTEPWWYFLPVILGAALPWTLLLAPAIPDAVRAARARRWDPRVVLGVLWVLLPLILFSLSRSKRPQYVLPLVPPIALLVALWWERRGERAGVRAVGGLLAALGVLFVVLAPHVAGWVPARPEVAALIPVTGRWLGAVTVLAGAAALALGPRSAWVVPALVLPVAAIPVVAMPLMDAIGRDRSSRDVAEALRPVLTAETEIVAVGTYPLSLPFYLGRTFTLVTADGRELTSNYVVRRHERLRRAPGTTLRPPGWWRDALATCDRPRIFLVPADSVGLQRQLASAMAVRAVTRKYVVYGPCGIGTLARRP